MKVVILGAGPAGLIAALWVQRNIAEAKITVLDRKPISKFSEPEVNHPFFVHEDIGPVLGVPLRKVRIMEGVLSDKMPAEWANHYAHSTIGILTPNVLWEFGSDPVKVRTAYMADSLLSGILDQLNPNRVKLVGGVQLKHLRLDDRYIDLDPKPNEDFTYDYLINTIPLPSFLGLSDDFELTAQLQFANVTVLTWDMRLDPRFNQVAQIFYHPEGKWSWTRFSNVFGLITVECPNWIRSQDIVSLEYFPAGYEGLSPDYRRFDNPPLRFIPANEAFIDQLIFKHTRMYGILHLGRFATWRYKRVDHLPADMDRIVHYMQKESA